MNTYRKIYRKAKKICKREGVRLIEAELKNVKIIMWFHKEYIIINSAYKGKKIPEFFDLAFEKKEEPIMQVPL